MYHTSKAITTAGVDLQTMGKDFLWVGRAETRLKAFGGVNKTAVGVTAARLVIEGFLPKKVRHGSRAWLTVWLVAVRRVLSRSPFRPALCAIAATTQTIRTAPKRMSACSPAVRVFCPV